MQRVTRRIRPVEPEPRRVSRVRPAVRPEPEPEYDKQDYKYRVADYPAASHFSVFMLASYQRYELGRTVVPSSIYDEVCKALYKEWGTFYHPDLDCVHKDALLRRDGSGITYPHATKRSANRMFLFFHEVPIEG